MRLNKISINNQGSEKKRRIIFFLQFASAILCLAIAALSVMLIYVNLQNQDIKNGNLQVDASQNSLIIQTNRSSGESSGLAEQESKYLPISEVTENFFGPLPVPESPEEVQNFQVRGLYIGMAGARSSGNFRDNISLVENSEMNSIIVNLKDESGVNFNSKNQKAYELQLVLSTYDLKETIETAHEKGIKVIGRIVCFKDPPYARKNPDQCIQDLEGNVLQFRGEKDNTFVNPYNTDYWEYLFSIAEEAVELGIDEIQLDYVRFPTGKTVSDAQPFFGESGSTPNKIDVINYFLQTARIRIQEEYGIPVTADVFGIILSDTSRYEEEILGQEWRSIGLTGISAVCPMAYPSHYREGSTINGKTFEDPNANPYDVMYETLMVGKRYADEEDYAVVRPYLQAFDGYGYSEINDQIRAVYDAGYQEWILWESEVQYPSGSYDGKP